MSRGPCSKSRASGPCTYQPGQRLPAVRPPHPQDEIYQLAKSELVKFTAGNKARRQDPFLIEALSPPATYLLFRSDLHVKIQLRANWSQDPVRPSPVVYVDGKWKPFSAWLSRLDHETNGWTSSHETRLRKQGEKTTFLSLPIELQDMILQFACGPQLAPREARQTTIFGQALEAREKDWTARQFRAPALMGFLLANKELSVRARRWALMAPKVCATLPGVYQLCNRLPASIVADVTSGLRSIELALSNADLVRFFRVPLPPLVHQDDHDYPTSGLIGLVEAPVSLRRFRALQEVVIFFSSTIYHDNNPWAKNKDSAADECCQRRLHEYMLPFIVTELWFVPEVRLDGYVKTATKGEWERLIGESKTEEGRAAVHEKKAKVLDLCVRAWADESVREGNFPPHCDCPEDCQAWTVNRKRWSREQREKELAAYSFDFDDARPRSRDWGWGWHNSAPAVEAVPAATEWSGLKAELPDGIAW